MKNATSLNKINDIYRDRIVKIIDLSVEKNDEMRLILKSQFINGLFFVFFEHKPLM